jgi:hypothetical protein
MPLTPAALPAVADRRLSVVRFAMRNGSKLVTVLVSNPALHDIEHSPLPSGYFEAFKRNRKCFERIASDKYARGRIEEDGTVCIRAIDLSLVSAD